MKEYLKYTLELKELDPNPYIQFAKWFKEAQKKEKEPEAMALATATDSGVPSCRMVLLKGWDRRGFLFFTNSNSRKGREINENPLATVVFYWKELERQVIGEGIVSKVSNEESDQYFSSRQRKSQLGAWASFQDEFLNSKEELLERFKQAETRFEGKEVVRPPHWEGYRVSPYRLEFWQGRENRLHDRFLYHLKDQWTIQQLNP